MTQTPVGMVAADQTAAEHIGSMLRTNRVALGMNQTQLAAGAGAHLNTAHRVEAGRGTILLTHMEAMLATVGLEIAVVPIGTRLPAEDLLDSEDPHPRLEERSARAVAILEEALARAYEAAQAADPPV